MKYGILAIVALASGLMLSACETMSAEECAAAVWRALGFNDAAASGADRLGSRTESCAEKGFAVDSTAYSTGFAEGLYRFCQPTNAFQFARRGGSFSGACPAELQYEFAGAYNDGRRVYDAESELNSIRSNISSLETRLDEIEHDMRSRERDIGDPNKTREERDWLRSDLERLRGERRDTIDDLRRAEGNIYYAERRVQDLRFEIGSRWAPW
jgi:hypothetical protein